MKATINKAKLERLRWLLEHASFTLSEAWVQAPLDMKDDIQKITKDIEVLKASLPKPQGTTYTSLKAHK